MSYDLRIFFAQVTFPFQEWREIMRTVKAEERQSADETQWFTALEGTTVWFDCTSMDPTHPKLCAPLGTHWMVTVHTTAGRSIKSAWAQFAVAYYALTLLEGISVHDCQHHEKGLFRDGEAFLKFSAEAMPGITRKRELMRLGLMTDEGLPIF